MNTLTLVCVLLCLAVVSGRHFEDRKDHERPTDIDGQDEEYERHREHTGESTRHRRRRWNMGYGYDYPPPSHGYYPERRDYDRNQDLSKIIRLLEEISAYIRRPQPPPPPPQPIYIPYPVPYAFPVYKPYSPSPSKGSVPNVTVRFPDMEDTNQNWGFVIPKDEDDDDDVDYARPISFLPIKPLRPMKVPPPSVEHGSSQSEAQVTTAAPRVADDPSARKVACSTAILACCADQNPKLCFANFGCASTFDSGNVCTPDSIDRALASVKNAYSPM